MLFRLSDIYKSYSGNEILRGVSFQVNPTEKIGLVGRNGAGKTTIFRLITEEEAPDSGELFKLNKLKIGLLEQHVDFTENETVHTAALSAFQRLHDIEAEMRVLEMQMAEHASEEVLEKYSELQIEFEHADGFTYTAKAEAMIITPNDKKICYVALSVVHDIWTPVPERFKDWIGNPRDNLYQSLHTSVISPTGQSFEVQIRTEEMHQIAEEGVAAHWKYKESRLGKREEDESLDELRKTVEKLLLPLVETTETTEDSEDFIESLKLDLYPKDVYAFTPMGKIIQLPRGSTPIDFAYAIHSEVGDNCTGAKIKGRIVPLRTELQNGDVVEILTVPNSKPSRDWLNYVVTSKARNRIRHWISEQQRVESIEIGRKLLEKEADKFRLSPKKLLNSDDEMKRIANEYGLGRPEDLLAAIGYGKTLPRNVLAKFLGAEKFAELDPEKKKETRLESGMKAVKKFIGLGEDAIIVKGVDNLLTTRARCCNPLRGEEIIGYISLGKGIVVHNKRCKNVQQLMVNKERIVDVEWAKGDGQEIQSVRLLATTENRTGMLAGITNAIAEIKTGIRDARAEVSKNDRGLIEVTIEVFDKKHLDKVITSVQQVPGVIAVERVNS